MSAPNKPDQPDQPDQRDQPDGPRGLGDPRGCCGPSRRRVLQGGAVGAGVLVLAACTPSDAPGAPSGSPADDGEGLVALEDVPVGGAVVIETPDGPVAVTQPTDGELVGFSGICTHQGCTVVADDEGLVCPCHGSVFDLATGENVRGPAPVPLPEVALEVRDGRVHLA